MNDFQKMDDEAGASAAVEVARTSPSNIMQAGGAAEYRHELVKKYHNGASSLVGRLRDAGLSDSESLLVALIDEVVGESDNLLGNQLMATENGELRDASVISYKRAEVLEKAIKAVASKSQFERESGVDVDSPSMVIIFTYFMTKVKDVFEKIDAPEEQRDIFFRTLGEETENWKRELREEFEVMKSR